MTVCARRTAPGDRAWRLPARRRACLSIPLVATRRGGRSRSPLPQGRAGRDGDASGVVAGRGDWVQHAPSADRGLHPSGGAPQGGPVALRPPGDAPLARWAARAPAAGGGGDPAPRLAATRRAVPARRIRESLPGLSRGGRRELRAPALLNRSGLRPRG